ncbi:hypothetical protein ACFYNM_29040 [Streptomyces spororaveus]|uniref:hypothetical protein n=1 Tax=Streptomyces spororaveus TaxID=284039 RepID=UPI003682FE7E
MSSVEEFRTGVWGWLRTHLAGGFAAHKGRGGPVRAGSDGIRRTLVAERVLGLPKEVRA